MKRIIALVMLIVFVIGCVPCMAKSPSDKAIVKAYCQTHYNGYKIKYFTKWNEEKMSHKANKKVVYVQIEKSVSSGKIDERNNMYWGYIKGQNYYKTWYNTKVKKGKEVTSYYIFNPYTNYEDDIVAVVDNKKIR